jgi:type IV secretory pathway TraG/TraD family ATPase VirD4
VGQLTVTATASRASRIPRSSRRSLPLPGDLTTLNSETQLLTTSSTEPASTLIPTYNNYDILRSATNTNTTERAHLTSASERDVTSELAPKRNAHRRSASCGPSVLIPNNQSALPDTTGAARPKGLMSDYSKENTNPVSTAKKVALCTSSPSSFGAEV